MVKLKGTAINFYCGCEDVIPEFDKNGNLPPGVHFCEWEEFVERFGTNDLRLRLMSGLRKAMEQLKIAGCRTIYIDGSFVTIKPDPGDFDACWDTEDVDINYLRSQAPKLLNCYDRAGQKAQYKGELFPSEQPIGNYGMDSFELFQRDRQQNIKGIIAIDLVRWNP